MFRGVDVVLADVRAALAALLGKDVAPIIFAVAVAVDTTIAICFVHLYGTMRTVRVCIL